MSNPRVSQLKGRADALIDSKDASAVLRDGRTSVKSKTAAGSALSQRASKKQNKFKRCKV